MTDTDPLKQAIDQWVADNRADLSDWTSTIFQFGETAWREYKSAAYYVELLRRFGFEVEEASAGMPTAFNAIWRNGDGPTIGGYVEYDGVPGNCQAADTVERPRDGLSVHAGGHTDPHSALGMSALGGFLAAQTVMKNNEITGVLQLTGEPAEKVRGSKPIHAAAGYYDDLDAAISFHPFYMLPLCNTVRWDTHCAACYSLIYTFSCDHPETWQADTDAAGSPIAASHAAARAPGADDALIHMYMTSRMLRGSMIGGAAGWSMNEVILTAGQATADNLPARLAQIQYTMRIPTIEQAETVVAVLDRNADAAAKLAHCTWTRDWVAKSRPGLANHAMAEVAYSNLQRVGAPDFTQVAAIEKANAILGTLGEAPMDQPFLPETLELIDPKEAEAILRQDIPPWQKTYTSDDYTEYCWHAPTVRLYIARPTLRPPRPGYSYPTWVMNALGGLPETIDPMVVCAARTIGGTVLDLVTKPDLLAAAKAEFKDRTGGGVGGSKWMAPLCDYDPPIHFRWPEYVETARGREWWIPTGQG